jgi:hypothetical protein
MKNLMRLIVALIGAISLFVAVNLWLDPGKLAPQFGFAQVSLLGKATMRADMGGLFSAMGVFMIVAAIKTSRTWLLGALLCGSLALLGRVIGAALDGLSAETLPPMAVEAVAIMIFVAARKAWAAPEPAAAKSPEPAKMPEGL